MTQDGIGPFDLSSVRKKERLLGFFLGLFLISFGVQGFDGITILEVSSSGKSLIVDRGTTDGIAKGDKGNFLLEDQENRLQIYYVAYGECIKTFSNYSYWFLRKIDDPELLRPGTKLSFTPLSQATQGRRPPKIKQKKVILKKGVKPEDYYRDSKIGEVPKELIQKRGKYLNTRELVKTKPTKKQDIETTDFDIWQDDGVRPQEEFENATDQKDIETLNDIIDGDAVREKRKEEVYQMALDGHIKKVNGLPQGVAGLYKDQEKDPHLRWMKKEGWTDSIYAEKRIKEKESLKVNPRAIKKIDIEGPGWSAEMTDEQLRRYLIRTGIAKEKKRQQQAMDFKDGNEVLIRYGWSITDHSSQSDENFQANGYAISIGYEYHLGRSSQNFKRWSLDIFFEQGVNFYDVGDINGRAEESSLKMGGNWYFYNLPNSLDSFIWYAGGGVKFGGAVLRSTRLTREYDYQLLSLPVLQVGVKYRFSTGDDPHDVFKVGVAVNLVGIQEVSSLKTNDTLEDNIEGSIDSNEFKLALGVSLYF